MKIDVTYLKQYIFISEREYVLDLLQKTEKLDSKLANAPAEQNHKISKSLRRNMSKFTSPLSKVN